MVGFTCKDIMKVQVDETYDASIAIEEETEGMLSVDMVGYWSSET